MDSSKKEKVILGELNKSLSSFNKLLENYMCGIVGAVSEQNVVGILIEGLKRLEYRGYDSAGLSFFDENSQLHTHKNLGKVKNLVNILTNQPNTGFYGIAHTRWATHG